MIERTTCFFSTFLWFRKLPELISLNIFFILFNTLNLLPFSNMLFLMRVWVTLWETCLSTLARGSSVSAVQNKFSQRLFTLWKLLCEHSTPTRALELFSCRDWRGDYWYQPRLQVSPADKEECERGLLGKRQREGYGVSWGWGLTSAEKGEDGYGLCSKYPRRRKKCNFVFKNLSSKLLLQAVRKGGVTSLPITTTLFHLKTTLWRIVHSI
jgi:hypothetical protein